MFHSLFHRLLIPVLVTAIVGTVWIIGWSQTLVQEAQRGYWPPLRAAQQVTLQQTTPRQETPPRTEPGATVPAPNSFH